MGIFLGVLEGEGEGLGDRGVLGVGFCWGSDHGTEVVFSESDEGISGKKDG